MGLKPISATIHGNVGGPVAQQGTPYAVKIALFLSPLVVPCTQPPYGMLSAVDLKTRRLLWSRPFGTAEQSGPRPLIRIFHSRWEYRTWVAR